MPNAEYFFKVVAKGKNGKSSPVVASPVIKAAAPAAVPKCDAAKAPPAIAAAAVKLQSQALTADKKYVTMTIQWAHPDGGKTCVTSYKTEWGIAGSGRYYEVATVANDPANKPVATQTFKALTPGTKYQIRITSVNAKGSSAAVVAGPWQAVMGTSTGRRML